MSTRALVIAAVLIIPSFLCTTDVRADTAHSVSVQGGWWNVEAEYCVDFGLFVDLGVPWFTMVIEGTTGGIDWSMGVEGKIGYQYSITDAWKLRAGFRSAFSFARGCPCINGVDETHTKSFGLLEVGLRYEHSSGLVIGVDLPVYVFDDLHELLDGKSSGVEHFPPGPSFLFSQIYCGYAWKF